jgi:hypothetical protein
MSKQKASVVKIAIVWLLIFTLASFLVSATSLTNSITLSVMPEAPRQGEPVVASFTIANPTDRPLTTHYELYVNDAVVERGTTALDPRTSTQYQYVHRYAMEHGRQVRLLLSTSSNIGDVDRLVSLPAYPTHLMSSFVSFAAFSKSVMGSLVSMEYFSNAFGTGSEVNTGLILTAVLIALLIFLEISQAVVPSGRLAVISSYRAGFVTMSTVLFIILVGIVFTRIVIIVAT